MEIADYYTHIFKRSSVKKYNLIPLDDETLNNISRHLNKLKPLYRNIKIYAKILPLAEVEVKKKKKQAPHYLAIFSEKKNGYLANIGFMFQEMDLFLSGNDIGSCWQGSPKPKEEIIKNSNLEFIIVMAFGNPKDPQSLHRSSISEFERKSLSEISSIKDADKLLEAARLAPSSGNIQPWFFTGNKNFINAYTSKAYPKKDYPPQIIKKYNTISMGTAIYHLEVAAEYFGKKAEIISDEKAQNNVPEGYDYLTSLKIK